MIYPLKTTKNQINFINIKMEAILGPTLCSANGNVPVSELDDVNLVLLYFSAHWCPPCRRFTPILTEFYTLANDPEKVLEIVFISSDRSEQEYKQYFEFMPWLSVPYNGTAQMVKMRYGVQGIPNLKLINKFTGEVVKDNCRTDVEAQGISVVDQWIDLAFQ